jgi:hypothetical protein
LFVYLRRGQHGVVIEPKRIPQIRRVPHACAQRHVGDRLFERQRRGRGFHRNSTFLYEQVSASGEHHHGYEGPRTNHFKHDDIHRSCAKRPNG